MALGPAEYIGIVAIVLVLFGASAIPKLARGLGSAKGEFEKAKKEFDFEAKKVERGEHTTASEQQIRKTATEMGIPEAGRSLDDVKEDLKAKMG
jgi:sec-independent protein translocase protein TatA